jgi:hypothetical protein
VTEAKDFAKIEASGKMSSRRSIEAKYMAWS